MKFTSILGETPYFLKPSEVFCPVYFKDLNLNQVTEHILAKCKNYNLLRYFYYPATTKEIVSFRQDILKEISNTELTKAIEDFSLSMRTSRQYMDYRTSLLERNTFSTTSKKKNTMPLSPQTTVELKQAHFLFDAAKFYTDAVTKLFHCFENYQIKSEGLHLFYEFLNEYISSDQFCMLCQNVQEIQESLNSLIFRMELTDTKLVLHDDYDTFDVRAEMIKQCQNTVSSKIKEMKSPFTNISKLEELEGLILSMLQKKHKDTFQKLKEFPNKYEDLYEPLLLQFEEEIQVYLIVNEFIKDISEHGFSFVYPSQSMILKDQESSSHMTAFLKQEQETPIFLLEGTYDIALACKYLYTPEKIITNHCYLLPGEHFFVVTGPNQGGKTTFARSIGQAIYFHQMGFPVAGKKAILPVFPVLLTHFPTEEDVKSGTGKLKEELERLKPMLTTDAATDSTSGLMTESTVKPQYGGFVILNELFTTATTYDAEIMGKYILKSFMKKGFLGIYVTHLCELARKSDGIVSMTALIDTDEKTRTYHLIRAEAKGIAYAQTLAEKYRLSREDVIKRIQDKL